MRLRLLAVLFLATTSCGGRPFAEGSSRDLTIVTSLPGDAPEILLLRAIVERTAIRIDDESAYAVRLTSPDDAAAYRSRNVLVIGYGGREDVPRPARRLYDLWRAGAGIGSAARTVARGAGAERPPFAFTLDLWLRGQSAGIIWTESREEWTAAVAGDQNRIFQALDRSTFASVRERVLSLPRDGRREREIERALGFSMRVPRGMRVLLDRERRAVLLLEEGPPARLLRVRVASGAPDPDARRARESLARVFRPDERTLDIAEPLLSPDVMAGATRQLHGRWEDGAVSAAGPYRYYEIARGTMHLQVDLAVFAPGRPKLPYLRELHAIAETIAPAHGK
jgi:hypothetical protein